MRYTQPKDCAVQRKIAREYDCVNYTCGQFHMAGICSVYKD